MRRFTKPTLFHLLSLLCITISLHPTTTFARPAESQSISISTHNDTPSELLPAIPHQKRVYETRYNNLGPYTMVLTSSSAIWSATQNLPQAALLKFLASVAAQAADRVAEHAPDIATAAEFGRGSITLGFVIRDGVAGSARIPWSLVELLATQFLRRVALGNAMAFRGVVQGPLGQVGRTGMGMVPWVEVVLEVGAQVVGQGIEWGIF